MFDLYWMCVVCSSQILILSARYLMTWSAYPAAEVQLCVSHFGFVLDLETWPVTCVT